MTNESTEQALTERLLAPATRREAFTQMVKTYGEQLYRQIRGLVISHDDTDDVLQNTFVKAWTGLDTFRGEARLSTWLYRIALNESLNFLNKQRARHQVSIDEADDTLLNKLETDPYFDGNETEKQLQKAILTLPEKQRIIFNLKYFQEMKYEEMSELLGVTTGALKASYHHAVKKIEEYFNRHD